MQPTDQTLARLGQLITTGLRLHYWDGQPSIPLRALAWIPGQGLLFAELGTIDQSGVHLEEAAQLVNDGDAETMQSTEFDLLTSGGNLIASLYPALGEAPPPPDPDWARFWASQLRRVKGDS